MRRFAGILYALFAAALPARAAQPESPVAIPSRAVGYTQHATALPGGRLANVATGRAMLLVPGSRPVMLAVDLIDKPGSWTQFVGWFPDGKTAIIGRAWESEANARFEEEHKTFRFRAGDWLYDTHLLDLATGRTDNVTAVERVSFFNTGVFPWPGDPNRLGFTALIDGISKPFAMDRDGRHKTDLARDSTGFSYGFSGSPDGKRIAYHENYQVWLADADGANRAKIDTGHPFNFAPTWSPDGQWLLFVSGEHYDCHPHIVRADGTGLRKIGDRNGYRGVMEFLDVPDFHGGSSDVPVWSHDGLKVYFTARVAGRGDARAVDDVVPQHAPLPSAALPRWCLAPLWLAPRRSRRWAGAESLCQAPRRWPRGATYRSPVGAGSDAWPLAAGARSSGAGPLGPTRALTDAR